MSDVPPAASGLSPLFPGPEGQRAWTAMAARLERRPFLFSEGMGAQLVMPARAAPWLVERSRRLVSAFHRFYRAVADVEIGPLADDPARFVDEPYAHIAAVEGPREAVLLGRYDCVLEADGRLRVIELNPVGVCTLHLRAVTYLARALAQSGRPALGALAQEIDQISKRKMATVHRYVNDTLAAPPERPVVALIMLPGLHRGTKLMWRRELHDAGCDVVVAPPSAVRVESGRVTVDGRAVDVLWVDWAVYIGFQQARYEQTRFTTKIGDFSQAGLAANRLLTTPGLDAAIADRVVTLVSPMRAYRALSKALLAWIERPELPITAEDRETLRAHVARTYDYRERADGVITPEGARQARETLVLKPCRFGGSHGVVVGRDATADEWARRIDEIWTDPEWVLQTFSEPVRDGRGAVLSLGLYDFGGELGAILARSAPQSIVSARTADIIVTI